MARPLKDIIAQLRANIANPSVSTTLIQTEDLEVLCNAADPTPPNEWPPLVESALTPHPTWKVQSFKYYAAHFLVGSRLTHGDLYGNINGLAHELQKQYKIGVEHGRKAPADFAAS